MFKFLIRHVHDMIGMSAPMNRKLIDRNINNILDIFLNNLLIKRRILIENFLNRTEHFKRFFSIK